MKKIAQYVGLDVHKDTVCMAVALGGPGLLVHELGVVPHDVPKVVQRILQLGPPECLQVAYEAGPTGYGLYRAFGPSAKSCRARRAERDFESHRSFATRHRARRVTR